jgi:hypothetical protein
MFFWGSLWVHSAFTPTETLELRSDETEMTSETLAEQIGSAVAELPSLDGIAEAIQNIAAMFGSARLRATGKDLCRAG